MFQEKEEMWGNEYKTDPAQNGNFCILGKKKSSFICLYSDDIKYSVF